MIGRTLRAVRDFLNGIRTLLFAAAVALVGIADMLDFTLIREFLPESKGALLGYVSIGIVVMRLITSGPVRWPWTEKSENDGPVDDVEAAEAEADVAVDTSAKADEAVTAAVAAGGAADKVIDVAKDVAAQASAAATKKVEIAETAREQESV